MRNRLTKVLTKDEISSLQKQVIEDAEADRVDAASHGLEKLLMAQSHQDEAVLALIQILRRECLGLDVATDIAARIAQAHLDDVDLLSRIGDSLEYVLDINDLNGPPPENPAFRTLVEKLSEFARQYESDPKEELILSALATAARLLGRQEDEIAERAYRRRIEIDPNWSGNHYGLGLFLKTRGRFEEGMKANQSAAALVEKPREEQQWNLGICATGAGHGAVALDVWQGMGQEIEMGRFDLPDGRYGQCKVQLVERPLAERTALTDKPGRRESIWIERLSPCHGIIRSVLYHDLGVDYGDVVLIDGAPITMHKYGDQAIPVFPHLATLVRRGYQFFDFAGTQQTPRQLADASVDLDGDAIVYSHTETYQNLCAACWRDPDLDHKRHESVEKFVVTGRIAAPGHIAPSELLAQLDEAIAKRDPCRLLAPDLCEAAGFENRASVERRRFSMLIGR